MLIEQINDDSTSCPAVGYARIARRRHRHRLSRGDPREVVGVGDGVVECELYAAEVHVQRHIFPNPTGLSQYNSGSRVDFSMYRLAKTPTCCRVPTSTFR